MPGWHPRDVASSQRTPVTQTKVQVERRTIPKRSIAIAVRALIADDLAAGLRLDQRVFHVGEANVSDDLQPPTTSVEVLVHFPYWNQVGVDIQGKP